MTKARANFRRPSVDISGASNYRCMEGIGLLAWRSASESDTEFADEIAYGDRTGWAFGMRCAAVTGDTNLIGYARQMLADNEYFNSLTVTSTIGNQGDSRDALDVFDDYQFVSAAPDSGVRLPMTDGQPDFAWADEENGIIAAKHGNERLWLETYYQAKTGTGVNGVGRFYYSTNNFDRYGMLEVSPQINFSGSFYVRPNIMDKPEVNFYVPPDAPIQAYQGERLPVAASDPLATDNQPFLGKALFWACRYGNFLIGINRSQNKTYQLQTPSDFVSATNLITGQNLSGTIYVAPQSTVVLYLSNATNSNPVPMAPLSLNAVGNATPSIALDWSAASGATGYNVKRARTSGGPYTSIANVSRGVTYYYVVSGTNANGEGYYNSMENSASGGLPLPWFDTDIGSVGVAGSANYNNGTFTVSGAGADFGGTADTCNFAYMSMTNNGTIVANLASEQFSGSGIDKVGLMMRDTTNSNSRVAALILDTQLGVPRLATRSSTGASMSWINGASVSWPPRWLKLLNSNNTFTAYVSSNGTAWTPVATNAITLNSIGLVGMVVCSRTTSQLNVSAFNSVSTPTWSPPPAAPLNFTATASNATVFLNWNSSTNATGYNLKRALVTGGPYSIIVSAGATNYTDTSTTNGNYYYYVVTATNIAGESLNSTEASAQPISLMPTQLSVQTGAGQIQFSWPLDHLGWHLESQSNSLNSGLGTNWITVPGSAGTNQTSVPIGLTNGSVFFRLKYP